MKKIVCSGMNGRKGIIWLLRCAIFFLLHCYLVAKVCWMVVARLFKSKSLDMPQVSPSI